MVEADLAVAGVEIAHLAAADGDKPKREARLSRIDQVEIDKRRQELLQRVDVVEAGALDSDIGVDAAGEEGIGIVEAGNAHKQRGKLIPRLKPLVRQTVPELAQPFHPPLGRIARDE